MAFSVETRLPFLDPRLVAFTFELPLSARIAGGWTKAVLRKAMEGRLPDAIRLRKDKIGFRTPEDEWLRHHDWEILRDLRDSIEKGGCLLWAGIQRRIDNPELSPHQQRELWRCISFQAWLDLFCGNSGYDGPT